ncbi:MAG TPA: fused MFS/spermidine synthase, partial [Polyangiaceae bacterium]|nr:fused MFS/spermidine synthase [Polyangiaceae bacterium]
GRTIDGRTIDGNTIDGRTIDGNTIDGRTIDDRTPLHAGSADALARRVAWIATIQLTIGGFVTFGLETTFTHLLATVAGTSAYAFSLMLFAFLIGLSLGSGLGRKWLPPMARLPQALLLCQLLLAAMLLIASQFWDYLPAYFASFGRWPYTLGFAAREFVRFIVCLSVMLPAAVCIGAQFPIAMEAIGHGWPHTRIQALGRASALNTVGNILGALVVGFVALPRLGSHRTLGLLTLVCLGLAFLALSVVEVLQRRRWFGLVATTLVVLLVQPPEFDLTRLSAGGNVYFKPQYYGRVIDHAESLDGGLTAVAITYESSRNPVKTLLTNGKFQGNNRLDSSGEMMAQTSFAIAPLLHTAQRDRALVIGFGTGTTTRVLDEAGFRHVVVAELSGDIISLADRHFAAINHGVIHRPNVHVHVTDGRNFLLLDRERYDVIGIELSSIWFAGAANLYNDEFYALVEPRLTERGVLQQWIQLHRLNHRDVISILVTLRQRFPRIWLYFLGKQGILVACKQDCMPSSEAIDRLHAAERLRDTLSVFDHGLHSVLNGRLLTPEGIDRLIDDYRNSTKYSVNDLLSTDDNLYLEYSTPRGNVREYDESIADNEAFLARFRAHNPFEATHLEFDARK